jgi:EmrB/QacA subfamily drug resistance transporter
MLVLAICCMSLFIVGLDATIVNLALPSIREDLHASDTGLQWTVDAYTLVIASLLVLSGSTADRIGRRRTFQVGLALFSVGSLLCSIAPNVGLLVVSRMVQAVGGSMLNPVAMSIITNTFTERRERARAIGVWGGVVGLSMALGPLVGGALVGSVGWRAIFWLNVPVGVLAIVLTALFVPESRAARPRKLDPIGQVLVMLVLGGSIFGIIEGPGRGWGSPLIVGCFAVAAVALAALLFYEPRREDPLLEPRFFRSVPFSGATVIAVCAFASLGGFLFLNSIHLQETRGLPAFQAGLLTLPMAAMTAVFGPRLPLLIAGVAMTTAGVLLSTTTADSPIWLLIVAYATFGTGFGMVNAPITNTAVSGMPTEQAGVAAAIASTSRQTGSALGVAVIGSFAGRGGAGWWIVAGCGVTVFVLGLVTTGKWARSTTTLVTAS